MEFHKVRFTAMEFDYLAMQGEDRRGKLSMKRSEWGRGTGRSWKIGWTGFGE